MLDGGRCGERQLLPAGWVERMMQPSALARFYGWLMWLNADGTVFPGASKRAAFMVGAGGHYIGIEPTHNAVLVVRWIDPAHAPGFIAQVVRALGARPA
jgi:CubicO group peptidase (beta-lactamase class C family)